MSTELMSLEDQARMETTLNIRGQIIREMTKDGKLPQTQEDREFLMKALDGSDKTVLARAKLKSDDAAAKTNAAAAAVVADVLRQAVNRRTTGKRVEQPKLPSDLVVTPNEGETKIGVETFELRDIMSVGQSK